MKYLVASDIHGSSYYAKKIIEQMQKNKINNLILLGDIYYHGPRNPLPQEYNPKIVAEILNKIENLEVIKGNCDSEVDQMISNFKFKENLQKNIFGKKVFFTHGHNYNKDNFSNLEFDIMFYGHFHTGFILKKDNKIFVNTGSVSLPKENTENSFVILDEEKKEITLKNFDGKILDKFIIG